MSKSMLKSAVSQIRQINLVLLIQIRPYTYWQKFPLQKLIYCVTHLKMNAEISTFPNKAKLLHVIHSRLLLHCNLMTTYSAKKFTSQKSIHCVTHLKINADGGNFPNNY